MDLARSECDCVVTSIFVNPLQFGPDEDHERYPRSLSQDVELCREKGVDIVFAPEVPEMYASPSLTAVEVSRIAGHLCGPHRPGHFRGVATVVLKLFNIVQPDCAYFGEKDYQQLCVIQRMVQDLNVPVAIVAVSTVREPDGLAVSSRNVYLDAEQRRLATSLFYALNFARQLIDSGESDPAKVRRAATEILAREKQIRVEYLEIVDTAEAQPVGLIEGPVRIAAAIWLGKTRLIDNLPANSGIPD